MDIRNELQEARACVLSQRQYDFDVLDEETFAVAVQALDRLAIARNLILLGIEDPATAPGMFRSAGKQAETVGAVLDTWRGDGLATVVPTTEVEG